MIFNQLTASLSALLAVSLLHLVEEVQTGFRVNFPLGEIPRPIFIGLNLILYTYFTATILLASIYHPLATPLAWPLAVVMGANGLIHLGIMAGQRKYFPGGWTAPLLILTAGIVINILTR